MVSIVQYTTAGAGAIAGERGERASETGQGPRIVLIFKDRYGKDSVEKPRFTLKWEKNHRENRSSTAQHRGRSGRGGRILPRPAIAIAMRREERRDRGGRRSRGGPGFGAGFGAGNGEWGIWRTHLLWGWA